MTILSGIKIIEIEGIGPGPFCGMLLADLGADVIAPLSGGYEGPGVLLLLPVRNGGACRRSSGAGGALNCL